MVSSGVGQPGVYQTKLVVDMRALAVLFLAEVIRTWGTGVDLRPSGNLVNGTNSASKAGVFPGQDITGSCATADSPNPVSLQLLVHCYFSEPLLWLRRIAWLKPSQAMICP